MENLDTMQVFDVNGGQGRNGALASPARTMCVCRRYAPRLNHRHADFQFDVGEILALYFNKLEGRPLHDLPHNA